LEMVDNVINPSERTSGRFSPHSTVQVGYFILYAHAPVPTFTFTSRLQPFHSASSHLIHAHIVKHGTGGSFALATQSLAYLDRLERTLRATVLANIDHLFAFHMAAEDARLLHELDGITEDDMTNLDDFQCYVKLSLGGHRLPVFSLNLDAPPQPDSEVAQLVRLRSQQRDARPAGLVDDLIRQIQARQQGAEPTTPATQRAFRRREEEERVASHDNDEGEEVSGRRRKKRGSGGHNKSQDVMAPSHLHLMYREEASREQEDEERDVSDV